MAPSLANCTKDDADKASTEEQSGIEAPLSIDSETLNSPTIETPKEFPDDGLHVAITIPTLHSGGSFATGHGAINISAIHTPMEISPSDRHNYTNPSPDACSIPVQITPPGSFPSIFEGNARNPNQRLVQIGDVTYNLDLQPPFTDLPHIAQSSQTANLQQHVNPLQIETKPQGQVREIQHPHNLSYQIDMSPSFNTPCYGVSSDRMSQPMLTQRNPSITSTARPILSSEASISENSTADSMNLEPFWRSQFQDIFPYGWEIQPMHDKPAADGINWKRCSFKSKVRFECSNIDGGCKNAWTSKNGQVTFHYNYDNDRQIGQVYFKLYGAACKKCYESRTNMTSPITIEPAFWYGKKIKEVLARLDREIQKTYNNPQEANQKRAEKPTLDELHQPELCEACQENSCIFV